MKNFNFIQYVRKKLLNYPFLFKWSRRALRLFRVVPSKHACMEDGNYFQRIFSKNKNIDSISFDFGLVQGSFKGTPYLLKIHPQNMIESCVYLDGIWEPHVIELVAGYLHNSNNIMIDVGANVGATSIPLARHFTEVHFYLFEPHPQVFKDLQTNISYNKLNNVFSINAAISNSLHNSLPFYAQKNTHNFGLSSFKLNHDIDDYEVIQVNCFSLDSKFSDMDRPVKVIKIDTQGHELEVLLSAQKLIARDRPLILFEFESEYFISRSEELKTKEALLYFFSDFKYDIFMNNAEHKYFPSVNLKSYFHGDIIAVPKAVSDHEI
jgi:FkbM family methyltransferase